ncbi:penicillin acylase family protein [Pseudoalteromonas sp. MMG012]|uniref:penicillin acylase family protein n=1 Tax=Pseudoalteromonas sp. MMG012 TaxID=2822686 RepID=UPI001B3A5215|nr:penicillin acylase family protein [Pseudoalteromonas sp. MMG012]MBQ4850861.1 penicillin acylase family protein [Pseudoalteromonas sp. MMG012]
MFKSKPLISRVIFFILIPLAVVVVYGLTYLQSSLPPAEGTLNAPTLAHSVKIHRDKHGVVYIKGKHDQDVFFATGVVHAQDRLWQLELQKRMTQGRLSEILGREALDSDIWIRSLGIHSAAEVAWQNLSIPAKQSITSYVAGINYWILQQDVYPIEFTLLNIEPQPWDEVDTIAWVKMFALNLAGNMNDEITNYVAAQSLPSEQLTQLFADIAEKLNTEKLTYLDTDKTLPILDSINKRNQQLQQQFNIGGKYVGSNAWVVSGSHTESNKAILANDPHLGLQIPSFWYAMAQQGDILSSEGMALVGTPLVIFGQNDKISWGGTNMMADVQDLYFETLNINKKGLYKSGGEWVPLHERIETIEVKPDVPELLNKKIKPVKIYVRETERGPLISDVEKSMMHPVSLRWTGLDADDTSYEAFFRLNYANDWQGFQDALGFLVAPALNVLYADTQGNIGYVGAGRVPRRVAGEGLLPLPAGEVNTDWDGYIPYQDMPKIYNPDSGVIVSANDGLLVEDYPYFISHAFAPSYRSERISTLLKEAERPLVVDDMINIQGDTVDIAVQHFLPLLRDIEVNTEREKAALGIVKNWNGNMSEASQAPSIFIVWQREIRKLLLKDELVGFWNQRGQRSTLQNIASTVPLSVIAKLLQQPTWCKTSESESLDESCQQLVNKALQQALNILENQLGQDMDDWHWGALQHTQYAHTPFSNVKVLDGIFERLVPNGGSVHSINVADSYYDKSQGFVQDFGAGMRQIIVVGDPNQHFYMNSTGQSGNPVSQHYDDMVIKFNQLQFERFNPEPAKLKYVELVTSH